jgi:uncharacterized protein
VVIVEYTAVGSITSTGAPYRQTVIAVFRVVGGEIAMVRDYLDPLAPAEARPADPPR